jgi:hypothetical protein
MASLHSPETPQQNTTCASIGVQAFQFQTNGRTGEQAVSLGLKMILHSPGAAESGMVASTSMIVGGQHGWRRDGITKNNAHPYMATALRCWIAGMQSSVRTPLAYCITAAN